MACELAKYVQENNIICQICNINPKVVYMCSKCNIFTCEECKDKIHSDVKDPPWHCILYIGEESIFDDVTLVEITIINEYLTRFFHVHYLKVCKNDCLWIGCGYTTKSFFPSRRPLQKVKLKESKIKVLFGYNIWISEAAVTPSDDLLLCVSGPILKEIPAGSKKIINSIYGVENFHPLIVHITKDNKVIIGASEDIEPFPEVRGRRCLILMNSEGKLLNMIEQSKNNKPLFTFPTSLTSTNNNNIFVVDILSGLNNGRVVVVDENGHVKNIFEGQLDTRDLHAFSPGDVVATHLDNVIIADLFNNKLHILNNNGDFLTCLYTSDIGIEWPCSLAFSTNLEFDILYIGCSTPPGSKRKAKLYKLKLSGC